MARSSVAEIFTSLRQQPRTTRTALSLELGLGKATVSEAIAQLLASGLVEEVGKQQQERGRRQVVLELQAATRLATGVQFSDEGCRAVLTDLLGNVLAETVRPLSHPSPAEFVDALVDSIEALTADAPAPVIGLGVGVPGLVDPNGREIIASVPYGWGRVQLADILEPRLGIPVVVANRAKAAALGEYWRGNHQWPGNHHHLAYLHVGAGIAAGYVMDGELFFGSGGAAGEIGHTTVSPDGPPCGCGNRGCLHTLAAEGAIIRDVRSRLRQAAPDANGAPLPDLGALTIPALVELADEGDPLVLAAVTDAATWLGIAIANLINLVNPSIVVVGGSVSAFGEPLFEVIRAEVRQRALWDALNGVPIVPANLGDDAGTLGAAALFLNQLDVADLLAPAS